MFGIARAPPRKFLVCLMTYPEHEKLSAVKDRSQEIGQFLDWLTDNGWHRMRWGTLTDTRICGDWNCVDGKLNPGTRVERTCTNCGGRGLVDVEVKTWINDHRTITDMLAEYFEIDLDKLEAEKRAMLEAIRNAS